MTNRIPLFLATALCAVASAQTDHLEPVQGTLFEYTFAYRLTAAVREILVTEKETEKNTGVIRIVRADGYPMPRMDLVMLVQLGDAYAPQQSQYKFVYRRVLNPETFLKSGKTTDIKFSEKQIPFDAKLANRMIAIWTEILSRTRYASDKEQLPSFGQGDYHSVFILGKGVQNGVAPSVSEGPIYSLSDAVWHLRDWIESDGESKSANTKFLERLAELERFYLNPKGK